MSPAFIAGLILGAFIVTACLFLWCAFANGNGLDQTPDHNPHTDGAETAGRGGRAVHSPPVTDRNG